MKNWYRVGKIIIIINSTTSSNNNPAILAFCLLINFEKTLSCICVTNRNLKTNFTAGHFYSTENVFLCLNSVLV